MEPDVYPMIRVKPGMGYVHSPTGGIGNRRFRHQASELRAERGPWHGGHRREAVIIGAGQRAATGESALSWDALSAADALALQNELLNDAALPGGTSETSSDDGHQSPAAKHCNEAVRVLARFEPSWFIYDMFNIWAYVLALGLGWGSLWLVSSVGFDL